jgi:hypothetical protein
MIRNAGGVLACEGPDSREYEISLVPWQEPDPLGWLRELDASLAAAWQDRR